MEFFRCKYCIAQYSSNDIAADDPKCPQCDGMLE